MPITEFNSFDDGLKPEQRARGNFVASIDYDDESAWIPYADGVWFQPCSFDVSAGCSAWY